jgi:hypothetical protein
VTGPEVGTESVAVLDATILNVLDRLPTECGQRLGRVDGTLTPVWRGGVAIAPDGDYFASYAEELLGGPSPAMAPRAWNGASTTILATLHCS